MLAVSFLFRPQYSLLLPPPPSFCDVNLLLIERANRSLSLSLPVMIFAPSTTCIGGGGLKELSFEISLGLLPPASPRKLSVRPSSECAVERRRRERDISRTHTSRCLYYVRWKRGKGHHHILGKKTSRSFGRSLVLGLSGGGSSDLSPHRRAPPPPSTCAAGGSAEQVLCAQRKKSIFY